jgi:hypothetical protein
MKDSQMDLSKTELHAVHKLCIANKQQLMAAQRAGCFYCLKIFEPSEINYWVDDKPSQSAVCPHCDVDAVLADDGSFAFTPELLKALNHQYFYTPTEEESKTATVSTEHAELPKDDRAQENAL